MDTPGTANIESPCVQVCELNEADICIGCGRSLDEIGEWQTASHAEKQQILERCRHRQRRNHQFG